MAVFHGTSGAGRNVSDITLAGWPIVIRVCNTCVRASKYDVRRQAIGDIARPADRAPLRVTQVRAARRRGGLRPRGRRARAVAHPAARAARPRVRRLETSLKDLAD